MSGPRKAQLVGPGGLTPPPASNHCFQPLPWPKSHLPPAGEDAPHSLPPPIASQYPHQGVKQPPHLLSKPEAVKGPPPPLSALYRDPPGASQLAPIAAPIPAASSLRRSPPALGVSGGTPLFLLGFGLGFSPGRASPLTSPEGICAPAAASCPVSVPSESPEELGTRQTGEHELAPPPRTVASPDSAFPCS